MLLHCAEIYAVSLILTLIAVAILYRFAPALGLVDHPAGRKVHSGAVPLIGGVSIVVGAGLTLAIGALFNLSLAVTLIGAHGHLGFLLGLVALAITGAVDDIKPIAARYKLLIQIACCTGAVVLDHTMIGIVGFNVAGFGIIVGPWVLGPFTVLVMLTIINGINMIDGVDGLAAGITTIGLILMAKAVIAAGHIVEAAYLSAFLGGMTAFLFLNFPVWPGRKASIFLGDSGSLLLGFTLAYLSVSLSALPGRVFKPSTALWFFLIPVADTVWIYLRRTWLCRSPFLPGRDHLHHQLMKYAPAYAVTWILTGSTVLMACGAYLAERLGTPWFPMVLLWVIAFFAYGWLTRRSWKFAWLKSRRAERHYSGEAIDSTTPMTPDPQQTVPNPDPSVDA